MIKSALSKAQLRLPRLRWKLRKLLLGTPPKGNVYYGDMVKLYDEERQLKTRWHKEQEAVQEFLQTLPRGMKVLDMPVGTGRFLDLFKIHDHTVTGFDASEEMLDATRKRAEDLGMTIELHKGDATKLPYDENGFDLVISTRFLRHVLPYEEALAALGEISRVSRRYAIIEMGFSLSSSKMPKPGKPMRDLISLDDIIAHFEVAGFKVMEHRITHPDDSKLRFKTKRRGVFLLQKNS